MAKRKRYAPADPDDVADAPPAWERAECAICGAAVSYERVGSGFAIHRTSGVDVDATFGVGDEGRPRCPNGHGEMDVDFAPEQSPEQPVLFDVTKPFNFEGAYLEVESLTVEVDRLSAIADDDKRQAQASREQWAEAAKRLHTLTLELRRRRLAKRDREILADFEPAGDPAAEPV